MSETLKIGPRGTLTLPKDIRTRYGLAPNELLIVEETPEGILLRPASAHPVEIYTNEQLDEFETEERRLEEYYRKRDGR